MSRKYKDNEIIFASDNGFWVVAEILHIARMSDHEDGEAYMIELRNSGERGVYDIDHLQRSNKVSSWDWNHLYHHLIIWKNYVVQRNSHDLRTHIINR